MGPTQLLPLTGQSEPGSNGNEGVFYTLSDLLNLSLTRQ